MSYLVSHFVNGEIVPGKGRKKDIYNPALGQVIGEVDLASKAEVEDAIAVAQAAYPAWRNTPPAKRAQVMFRLKGLMEENKDSGAFRTSVSVETYVFDRADHRNIPTSS